MPTRGAIKGRLGSWPAGLIDRTLGLTTRRWLGQSQDGSHHFAAFGHVAMPEETQCPAGDDDEWKQERALGDEQAPMIRPATVTPSCFPPDAGLGEQHHERLGARAPFRSLRVCVGPYA